MAQVTLPADSTAIAAEGTPTAADSTALAADSTVVAADSVAWGPGEAPSGVLLTPPPVYDTGRQGEATDHSMSWVVLGLFAVFAVVCLRFRNNARYISALWRDLTEVRWRQNAFDETVRETSFLLLLNLLWCVSAGVLLHSAVVTGASLGVEPFGPLPAGGSHAVGTALCMGVAAAYTLVMTLGYWVSGNVFTDGTRARMWVKGYYAAQGLAAFVFFPLALLSQGYPQWDVPLLWTAAGALAVTKVMFMWKGLRIFFNQFSSWVLFLYYLCSLEIVPLILTYLAAAAVCVHLA